MAGLDEYEAKMLARHKATTGSSDIAGPDLHARTEFTCGLCATFAAALHDRTGWDIAAEFENSDDIAHVWCVNENGNAVDINGVHSKAWARTPFSGGKPGKIAPYPRSECNSTSPHAESDFQWANEILDAHPELYLLPPTAKPIF